MRTWRVGTVSMGAALVGLGVLLLLSNLLGFTLTSIVFSWWPILFIVLGIEILLFLFVNKKEQSNVKYDIFSILFIGILGTVGLGLAVISTLGISKQVTALISSYEETVALPDFGVAISNDVKRVVIETGKSNVQIEGTNTNEFFIFGTYRDRFSEGEDSLIKVHSDYVATKEKGDTLYVTLKKLPEERGLNYYHSQMNVKILIPTYLNVEVIGEGNTIDFKPRIIAANYSFEGVNTIDFQLPADSEVLVDAWNVNDLTSQGQQWEITERETIDDGSWDEQGGINGQLKIGSGETVFRVSNSNNVHVFVGE